MPYIIFIPNSLITTSECNISQYVGNYNILLRTGGIDH